MLELRNISGGYKKGQRILHNISFEINDGEIVGIIGQNGSGKSSLAKAITGILPYKKGEIIFNNKDISKLNTKSIINKGVSYFMQGGQVFPQLSIYENLIFVMPGLPKDQIRYKIEEISEYFDIVRENNFRRKAGLLSGGEKHQLALAMLLCQTPSLLILDEPSAGLDFNNIQSIYKILNKLKENRNITIILIEQNVEKAFEYANQIILLKNGKIEAVLDSNDVKDINNINKYYFS